ncbi:helix-turn-helix domain-containing protein [Cesiribacter sp. SM1]|uniref:IS1/IS1595 family N-terminal zinc-binding domain-containing protein n=1 Tax=Cesiribacter sp. SM1 TaxID=2861196 RepID=UPI001CD25494|nr:helix-turn-helix domain-containing protein [Cesiribacter sp. SM1]
MNTLSCPKCQHDKTAKSGIVKNRQRYRCKQCNYHFTVEKAGKQIDSYYVIKALQLHLEGVGYREIERLLGVSHVTVMNWVKKWGIKAPDQLEYRPTYSVMNHQELLHFMKDNRQLKGMGMLVTELGDKYMVIRWERFRVQ